MKYILPVLFAVLIISSGCDDQESNMRYIETMKDTLFKAFPTVNRVSVQVDYTGFFNKEVTITFGDADLYNATDAERDEATRKAGLITLAIFDKDKWPDKGNVTFVREENTIETDKTTEKVHDMHIEDLKLSVGK